MSGIVLSGKAPSTFKSVELLKITMVKVQQPSEKVSVTWIRLSTPSKKRRVIIV